MNTLFTKREVAKIFNVSYHTIKRLMSDQVVPLFYLRIGGSIRCEKKDVVAYKYFRKKYTQLNTTQRCEVQDYENAERK